MREKPGEREASPGRGESRERRVEGEVELRERSSRGRGGGDAGVRQGETVRGREGE